MRYFVSYKIDLYKIFSKKIKNSSISIDKFSEKSKKEEK